MKKALLILSFLFLTSCSLTGGNNNRLLSITLSNSKVKLAISEKMSFATSSTSLSVNHFALFEENTYSALPSQDILDNEETPYNYGAYTNAEDQTVMRYLKYTFYVKNVGDVFADYTMDIKFKESKSSDGTERMLSDTLRVMVYENDIGNDSKDSYHDVTIYAKEAAEYNIDKEGNRTKREFVAQYPYLNEEDDEHPLATSFIDSTTIASYQRREFGKNQIRRYTLVTWLEGEDPQSEFLQEAPKRVTISLSININAYLKG